jgi:hypothetical protein
MVPVGLRDDDARRWQAASVASLGLWLISVVLLLPLFGAGLFGSSLPVGPVAASGALLAEALAYVLTLFYIDASASGAADVESEVVSRRRFLVRALGWSEERQRHGQPQLRREPRVAHREEDVNGLLLERDDLAEAQRRVLHHHSVLEAAHVSLFPSGARGRAPAASRVPWGRAGGSWHEGGRGDTAVSLTAA